MGPKFAAYEEHGVSEYWVLDRKRWRIGFYRREEGGELVEEFAAGEEIIRSRAVAGFWVKRAWLKALLEVAGALAEIVPSVS